VLTQIGVPFMNRRNRMDREKAGGLGLGLFIAKTLLERSGATLHFQTGAVASVWCACCA
jgi:two-component system sensor histidine kinase RegB